MKAHRRSRALNRRAYDSLSLVQPPWSFMELHGGEVLQQQGFDAVRVDDVVAGRPAEDREAAILRGDQGD